MNKTKLNKLRESIGEWYKTNATGKNERGTESLKEVQTRTGREKK